MDNTRLTDSERAQAIDKLTHAVGQGCLSIAEFEERSEHVLAARTRGELRPVIIDLPSLTTTPAPKNEVAIYSHADIEAAYQAARNPRLATGIIGTLALTFGMSAASGIGALACSLLIPTLWVLLYVAKIGPASWHVPNPRVLARQKRRQEVGQLADDALGLARKKLNTWTHDRG